ncbi:MAG: helix-hairpin-helix domain-containing protein [Acidobacteriota bacterium]
MRRTVLWVSVSVLLWAGSGLARAVPLSQNAPAETKASSAAIVNLNTASAEQLEKLPGIGPKTALRIIEYRQKNGGFKKVEELMNVRGIGEKSFLKIKPQLTVGALKPSCP